MHLSSGTTIESGPATDRYWILPDHFGPASRHDTSARRLEVPCFALRVAVRLRLAEPVSQVTTGVAVLVCTVIQRPGVQILMLSPVR